LTTQTEKEPIVTNIRAAVITPDDIMLFPEQVFKDSRMGDFINDAVGGYFDVVRPLDASDHIVGYVHDEGLLMGLEPNALASALFGRFLVGNCVVVGAFDKEGNYDGDDHNINERDIRKILWLADQQQIWVDHRVEEEDDQDDIEE
jgi:hypothetical protein